MNSSEPRAPLSVGQRATVSKMISPEDIKAFAVLTGDWNPLHLDEAFASRHRFGRPIVHGMLVAGIISAALGTVLPGPGAIYLSQTLKFAKPVYPGDTVTATVEVTAYREAKGIVTLRTVCRNQVGEAVLDGEAVLLIEKSA